MPHCYQDLNDEQVAALAARVLKEIIPEIDGPDEDERRYRYTDSLTRREFEIRRSVGVTDKGTQQLRYFMSEYVPNGRAMVRSNDKALRSYDEPRIFELEQCVGPNRLARSLQDIELAYDDLVLMGGGYCLGAIYHTSLQDCAAAIARALADNVRYEYFQPLTEQQKVRQAYQDRQQSHAYWTEQRNQLQQAQSEAGLFKGCSAMMGPLSEEVKRDILAYLNAPTQTHWLKIRGYVVTGSGTLWQAWCEDDPAAPRSGDTFYPTKEQLVGALRAAVARREARIAARLAKSHSSGLRAV